MVVLVKYGIIVHAPNPMTAAPIIAIMIIVLFFIVSEFN
jgi:hypothetical protein